MMDVSAWLSNSASDAVGSDCLTLLLGGCMWNAHCHKLPKGCGGGGWGEEGGVVGVANDPHRDLLVCPFGIFVS